MIKDFFFSALPYIVLGLCCAFAASAVHRVTKVVSKKDEKAGGEAARSASKSYYTASMLAYVAAIMMHFGEVDTSSVTTWICIGSLFLCLGSVYAHRSVGEKETDANTNNDTNETK